MLFERRSRFPDRHHFGGSEPGAHLECQGKDDIQRQGFAHRPIVKNFRLGRKLFIASPVQHRNRDIPGYLKGKGRIGHVQRCTAQLSATVAKTLQVIAEAVADKARWQEMWTAEEGGASRQILLGDPFAVEGDIPGQEQVIDDEQIKIWMGLRQDRAAPRYAALRPVEEILFPPDGKGIGLGQRVVMTPILAAELAGAGLAQLLKIVTVDVGCHVVSCFVGAARFLASMWVKFTFSSIRGMALL